jgi:HK97 family phage portal protein
MALWDRVSSFLALQPILELGPVLPEKTQARAIDSFVDHPGLTEQLLEVQGLTTRPWRNASFREALGHPAIFRAVSLIANTTGALSLHAWRNGRRLPDEDRPRLIVRPNPLTTPRDFLRDTAFYIAAIGEAWWYVAVRDPFDNLPMSLVVVPPHEVRVEPNEADRFQPRIYWGDRLMRNEDMRQITWLKSGLRGFGPLQLCGAAISAAVEAQWWAASFYAEGGLPSVNLHSDEDLDENEAAALKAQYAARDANSPFVSSGPLSLREIPDSSAGGQMLEARDFSNGDVARMFGIPGKMLEYGAPGSSLTYQNISGVMEDWVRTGLWPNVLEGIEQELSDLLPRSTVARFNLDALLRADTKTRWEVYNLAVSVLGPDDAKTWAATQEGFEPGNVENAPIPASPPQATPAPLPIQMRTQQDIRCDGTRTLHGKATPCNKLLATNGAFAGTCPRCHKEHNIAPVAETVTGTLETRAVLDIVQPALNAQAETFQRSLEALVGVVSAAVGRPMTLDLNVRSPDISVTSPDVNITTPEIHLPEQPPPVVNVEAPAAPNVTVNVPEPKATRKRIERDEEGRPTAVVEEAA